MLAMFGMVMAYGIKMLSSVDFGKQENLLIVACSVGIGLELQSFLLYSHNFQKAFVF